MGSKATQQQSIMMIERNLQRVKKLIKSPDVRPSDIMLRDQLARCLHEAKA